MFTDYVNMSRQKHLATFLLKTKDLKTLDRLLYNAALKGRDGARDGAVDAAV